MNTHSALVPATGPALLDPLAKIARRNGFTVERDGNAMVIDAPLGRVAFDPSGTSTRLTLTANTPAELQLLTDLYAGRLTDLALDQPVAWDAPKASMPLNQIIATVIGVLPLSPNFARLRLSGDFSTFAKPDTGLHFRLLLHPDTTGWPTLDAGGLTQWPGGVGTWHRPPYTVRRISAEGTWIDVDIVLHAGGRVTDWCDMVAPGDEVALHGPSGSKQPTASWLGLLGDETALPVILRIIEDAPAGTKGRAVVAVRHPDDAQAITTQADIPITWVDMADESLLIQALDTLDIPETDRHILFAAERAQANIARDILRDRGLSGAEAKAASYWTK